METDSKMIYEQVIELLKKEGHYVEIDGVRYVDLRFIEKKILPLIKPK